ncbi:MAG TPA: hypothetical protein VN939_18840 [Chthoniobacterales bacterium]|jgi:hypothetical protein|nr:hypothetical protein [Chthoniobacterales bacterium]
MPPLGEGPLAYIDRLCGKANRSAFAFVLVVVVEFGPSGLFEYCALSELHPPRRLGDAEGAAEGLTTNASMKRP